MSSRPVELGASDDPVAAFRAAHHEGRHLALPTSGSTGTPRTIVRSTESWADSFATVTDLLDLTPASAVWIPGPLAATMNLFAAVHTTWSGASRATGLAGATHAHLTPTALRAVLADDPAGLAGVHVLTAGDRLDPTTHAAATAAGARVSHYYGAAELSFVAWGSHAEDLRPFPGVRVAERSGELWVHSPYVCRGYAEPGGPLRRDSAGWCTVGDRGQVRAGAVRVHGRADGVTTGAATVLVADVERVLAPAARGQVVVTGAAHPDLGEVLACVLSDPRDLDELRRLSRTELAPSHRPRRWFHLEQLPVTAADKVDRAAVRLAVSTRGVAVVLP